MNSKIAFITSTHSPFDDRIYYHQAATLANNGYTVRIISSIYKKAKNQLSHTDIISFNGSILNKRNKLSKFIEFLNQFSPEIIICSEPFAILAALCYKKKHKQKSKIIYDVTEWYPSKKNLSNLFFFKKTVTFFYKFFLNFILSSFVNGFIFGEYYKSLPYKLFFPFKKKTTISYYPDLKHINYHPPLLKPNTICLGYAGKITTEKGIDNFLNVIKQLNKDQPALKINLKIIGWFPNAIEEINYRNQLKQLVINNIDELNFQDYPALSDKLKDIDIFFDLRIIDFENKYCLPIKLFYYMACGRPVIYSNLKAITKHIDITSFGYMVNPKDSNKIASLIIRYINYNSLYYEHGLNARKSATISYNWKKVEPNFLKFISLFHK